MQKKIASSLHTCVPVVQFEILSLSLKIMEIMEFKWSERDNRCAVIKCLVASNFEMTNSKISVHTVLRIRTQLMESRDISQV